MTWAIVLAFLFGVCMGIYITLAHPIYMRLLERRIETRRIMRQATELMARVAQAKETK